MIRWTDEALDAAISQLKALRFSSGMTLREQMAEVLHAAWRTQILGADTLQAEIDKLEQTINSLPEGTT